MSNLSLEEWAVAWELQFGKHTIYDVRWGSEEQRQMVSFVEAVADSCVCNFHAMKPDDRLNAKRAMYDKIQNILSKRRFNERRKEAGVNDPSDAQRGTQGR